MKCILHVWNDILKLKEELYVVLHNYKKIYHSQMVIIIHIFLEQHVKVTAVHYIFQDI
jgi:hypothetical protein